MKTAKWIILISLLLLLLAGRRESADQLKAYVEDQLQRYYAKEISFDRIMGILSALSKTGLPQQDVSRCRHDAEKMEQARTDLAQADALYQQGDYGSAIPLYRKSLIADEGAPYRLMQAEALYKNTTLDQAEADMADGRYDDAEAVLSACLSILEGDMDLSTALADVGKLKAGQIYHSWTEEARRLLTAEDPEKAFAFVADLREQSPDSYELEYLDQLIRHEYEADTYFHDLDKDEEWEITDTSEEMTSFDLTYHFVTYERK